MKTLMGKCGVGVVMAVVLLAMAVVVTGCPAGPGSQSSGYKPPEGMGAVQLNLRLDNPNNARVTIMPDDADINTFKQFYLDFQPTGGGAVAQDDFYTLTQLATPITLAPGTYTLEVVAYMDDADPPILAAAVGTTSFTVAGGDTAYAVPVTLYAYDPDEGDEDGTFAWNITVTNLTVANVSTASMTVTPIGTGTSYGPYNLKGGTAPNAWVNGAGVPVVEGYYYVNFSLTSSGVTRTYRHVLQIYRGHTSTFEYEFTDAKLGIVATSVTVTPTYNHPEDNPPELLNGAATVSVGGTVTISSTVTTAVLSISNATDYNTYSWFCGGDERSALATYTVTYGTAPFNAGPGTYSLTVTGFVTTAKAAELNVKAGAPFSTEIFIKVD
jgi:hypothetical protein